ncbi:MAG: hypothetical protein ACE5JV_04140 [Nitrososphaerales archaeon]
MSKPYGQLYGGFPPHENVDTSIEAAHSQLFQASSVRGRLYRWALKRGSKGFTDDEAEVASGFPHQTISARRRELYLLGLVIWSGDYRRTRTGRRARVWVPRKDQ